MQRNEMWARLCELLDDDPAVRQGVLSALRAGEDSWEALLDGLDEAGALAYLQADDTGMELTDALAQLPRVFALQPDLGGVADTDDLREATASADDVLAADGLRLLRLIEEGDAWPLVVVPAALAAEVRALASDLGQRIVISADDD